MNHTTADYLESLINDLATLKTNLAAKGVEVTEDDDFTSLAAKVPMITSGAFKVASIAERDAIQYKREGDICLVMTEDAYEPITPTLPITANSIINFKRTVTFEQEPQGWSGLWLVGGSGLNLMYNQLGSYDQNYIQIDAGNLTITYHTEDGLTFTTDDDYSYTPSADLTYSNGDTNYLNLMELFQYTPGEYLGLYTYNGSSWVGVDFGNTATANDIIENLTGVFNNGLQTGTFPRMNVKEDVKRVIDYANRPIVLPADATGYLQGLSLNVTDLSYFKFNAAATTNINSLFYGNNQITELDLSDWGWSATITNIQNAFMNMSNLEYLDISGLKLGAYLGVRNETKNFSNTIKTFIWKNGTIGPSQYMNGSWLDQLTNVEYLDLTGSNMAAGYGRYNNIFNGNNTKLKTVIMKNVRFTNMNSQWYWGGFRIPNVETIDLSGCYFSVPNSVSTYQLFYDDTKLTDLNLNFSSTVSPTNFNETFYNCSSLTEVDLTKFSFSRLTNFYRAFYNCSSLVTITGINRACTINNVNSNFYNCSSLTALDLTNWDTSGITNDTALNQAFYNCSSLISLDLSTWACAPTRCFYLFYGCTSLQTLDIRNFDFTNMGSYADYTFGNSNNSSTQVPANCLIIVKDQTAKDWITTNYTWLTNVQTVAEYEASLEGGE